MYHLKLKEDFIRLGQTLKAAGFVDSGAEAKMEILGEQVYVNGEICTMRGKKLTAGDIVTYKQKDIIIEP